MVCFKHLLFNIYFIQHKNHAFNNKNKHTLFYNKVVKYGWNYFKFNTLYFLPTHVRLFSDNN